MNVGIRELRDSLSRHLAHVRAGHVVTVTDHGRPVARLVPITEVSRLEQLISDGLVTRGRGTGALPRPVPVTGTVSDLVVDERR